MQKNLLNIDDIINNSNHNLKNTISVLENEWSLFDLSSHNRAKKSIEFSLGIRDFNVFVIADERSGAISSTYDFLKEKVKELPLSNDYIYLNNFDEPHRPKMFSLPPGVARLFKERMQDLIKDSVTLLERTLGNYLKKVETSFSSISKIFKDEVKNIKDKAEQNKLRIIETNDGFKIESLDNNLCSNDDIYSVDTSSIQDELYTVSMNCHKEHQKIQKKTIKSREEKSLNILKTLFSNVICELDFHNNPITTWLDEARKDMVKNFDNLMNSSDFSNERYSVCIMLDNYGLKHPKVTLEGKISLDTLFGEIKYKSNPNMETNFTMIRPGALHRSSGGILILRAESISKNPEIWEELKSTIRDRKIRIKERISDGLPLLNAPSPESIPLDVQIFLIGSPLCYYSFFFNDPDFYSYFKIKAEIDPDMPLSAENKNTYISLIQKEAKNLIGKNIDDDGISYLLNYSSRSVEHTNRISSEFDMIQDILKETKSQIKESDLLITKNDLKKAISDRRDRNMHLEHYNYLDVKEGHIFIETSGTRIGQINGLTITGFDHQFGMPTRITARTYAGDGGLMNIERMIDLSGPIHQKGSFIIEGFLNGLFAQSFQLPCGVSITFEQSYFDVEGDSASLGELIAILSSLSNIGIKQDIAITGSMDQIGRAQSVGGIHLKIEGFHKVCKMQGLNGFQGVIIPKSNIINLTINEEVIDDIKKGMFHIWTVNSIYEALEIMLNTNCGLILDEDGFPKYASNDIFEKDSIFYKAFKKLKTYRKSIIAKDEFHSWKKSFV